MTMTDIEKLNLAIGDFVAFLRSLEPAQLRLQDWGPHEVLAHLLSYHELYVAQTAAAVAGVPQEIPSGRYSDLNARSVEQFRDCPLDEMIARLELANRELARLYALHDPQKVIIPIKTGVRPYFLERLVPEVASHFNNHLKQLRRDLNKRQTSA